MCIVQTIRTSSQPKSEHKFPIYFHLDNTQYKTVFSPGLLSVSLDRNCIFEPMEKKLSVTKFDDRKNPVSVEKYT